MQLKKPNSDIARKKSGDCQERSPFGSVSMPISGIPSILIVPMTGSKLSERASALNVFPGFRVSESRPFVSGAATIPIRMSSALSAAIPGFPARNIRVRCF